MATAHKLLWRCAWSHKQGCIKLFMTFEHLDISRATIVTYFKHVGIK